MIKRLIEWLQTFSPNYHECGRWMRQGESNNPFQIEVFDCADFIQSLTSTTGDPEVAQSFVRRRESDGSGYIGKFPDRAVEIQCHLDYPPSADFTNGRAFKASTMEQKWDIYLHDNHAYFCRSWLGDLVYVASFSVQKNGVKISRIWTSEGTDGEETTLRVDFLVKSYIYGRKVPSPMPKGFPRDPQGVAMFSWAVFGNACSYATFEDTLPWDLTREASQ